MVDGGRRHRTYRQRPGFEPRHLRRAEAASRARATRAARVKGPVALCGIMRGKPFGAGARSAVIQVRTTAEDHFDCAHGETAGSRRVDDYCDRP